MLSNIEISMTCPFWSLFVFSCCLSLFCFVGWVVPSFIRVHIHLFHSVLCSVGWCCCHGDVTLCWHHHVLAFDCCHPVCEWVWGIWLASLCSQWSSTNEHEVFYADQAWDILRFIGCDQWGLAGCLNTGPHSHSGLVEYTDNITWKLVICLASYDWKGQVLMVAIVVELLLI